MMMMVTRGLLVQGDDELTKSNYKKNLPQKRRQKLPTPTPTPRLGGRHGMAEAADHIKPRQAGKNARERDIAGLS